MLHVMHPQFLRPSLASSFTPGKTPALVHFNIVSTLHSQSGHEHDRRKMHKHAGCSHIKFRISHLRTVLNDVRPKTNIFSIFSLDLQSYLSIFTRGWRTYFLFHWGPSILCTLTTTSIPQSTSMPIYFVFPLATTDEITIHTPFTCPLVLSPSTYSRISLQNVSSGYCIIIFYFFLGSFPQTHKYAN